MRQEALSLLAVLNSVLSFIVTVSREAGGINGTGCEANEGKEEWKRLDETADATASAAEPCSVGERRAERHRTSDVIELP